VVRVLGLHRCTCAERVLGLHHDVLAAGGYQNHHDGRDLALHLYMYVVRESVLCHHDVRAVRALVLRRCTCAERELVQRLYGNDLLVHHHDESVGHESGHRRCTCAERVLDVHLHIGHVIHLVFRHPCAVVYRKDSKHHYCALRHALQRAVIQLDCGHLDRAVRAVHGIRLLPP
jgi:hypothetical protein